jgi:UDP-N-acetylmuramoyl-tripeptide--D-alanyl-D-alanine ligase
MSSTVTRGLDWLERSLKPAVKALYQRPITEVSRVWRRALVRTRFIGITGSGGKTTTKNLLHAALAGRYASTRNHDSDNQLYDIARTLMRTGLGTRFCVQEVGASAPGRFQSMLALLRPQVGVVTNIGTDHISAFGSSQAVAAEKTKLIASLPSDGIAVLNADEPLVAAMAGSCRGRVVTYGIENEAQFRGEVVTDRWPQRLTLRIHHAGQTILAPTRLLPGYQAGNVLAAVATACSLGVTLEQAVRSISQYEPILGGMTEHSTKRGITFIRDDGKAPEWSLHKALQYLARAEAARKIAVIGTISDAGRKANMYRRAVEVALTAADHVLLVGQRAAAAAPRLRALGGEKLSVFETVQEAAQWLRGFARAGDLVLLKGSAGADHLARLALSIDQDVRCWRARCPRGIFCDRCSLVGVPAAP